MSRYMQCSKVESINYPSASPVFKIQPVIPTFSTEGCFPYILSSIEKHQDSPHPRSLGTAFMLSDKRLRKTELRESKVKLGMVILKRQHHSMPYTGQKF